MNRKVRVMTFNIRYENGDKGKPNDWNNRKDQIIEIINKYNPNIIGCQEVLPNQFEFLRENLNNYESIGIGRNPNSKSNEHNPIFYKDVKLLENGTFWLSDTPNVCSNSWKGGSYRICTWANFDYHGSFGFYNTHLDNRLKSARLKSVPLIIRKMETQSPHRPIILTGDFNMSIKSKTYREFLKHFKDAYFEINGQKHDKKTTFHDFKGIIEYKRFKYPNVRIDYIFLKEIEKIYAVNIINDAPKKNYKIFPSDHWPMYADLLL